MNLDAANMALYKENNANDDASGNVSRYGVPLFLHCLIDAFHNQSDGASKTYCNELSSQLLKTPSEGDKILAFKAKAPLPAEGHQSNLRVLYSQVS